MPNSYNYLIKNINCSEVGFINRKFNKVLDQKLQKNIESFVEYAYMYHEYPDKVEWCGNNIYTFNKKGRLINEKNYNADLDLISESFFAYYRVSDLLEEYFIYDGNGQLSSKIRFEFDSQKNLIKAIEQILFVREAAFTYIDIPDDLFNFTLFPVGTYEYIFEYNGSGESLKIDVSQDQKAYISELISYHNGFIVQSEIREKENKILNTHKYSYNAVDKLLKGSSKNSIFRLSLS